MSSVLTGRPPDPAARARERGFMLALVSAATALAGFRLGAKGLWYDEVASLSFALRGPSAWVADHNMALYYALLGAWIRVWGESEAALRSLSAVCFIAAAPLFYHLAKVVCHVRGARLAAALFLSHATLMHFAQEARGYMLALLLVLGSTLCLLRMIERPSWPRVVSYAVVAALASYAHLLAALVALAQGCSVLWLFFRQGSPRARWSAAFLLLALLTLPLLLQAVHAGAGQVGWLYRPTWRSARETLVILAGGSPLGAALLTSAWLAFSAHTLLAMWTRTPAQTFAKLLTLLWFAVPVLLAFGISLIATPIVHPKYLLVAIPALLLAAAHTWTALPRGASAAAFTLFALLGLTRLHVWYTQYQRELFREAIERLAAQHHPGDAIAIEAMSRDPFDYYVQRLGLTRTLPAPITPPGGWGTARAACSELPSEQLQSMLDAASRIWLLTNRADAQPLRARITATHLLVHSERFEPRDEDDRSVFADSSGRIIALELFERESARRGRGEAPRTPDGRVLPLTGSQGSLPRANARTPEL